MNPEVLEKAVSTLRARYLAGKSDRALLAKTVKGEQLKVVLARRFRATVGDVVKTTLPTGTIGECQELHTALLKAFSAESRGESEETLAAAG